MHICCARSQHTLTETFEWVDTELALPYEVKPISLTHSEQKEKWYLEINPNGRIPALVDHNKGDLAVFESGALCLELQPELCT